MKHVLSLLSTKAILRFSTNLWLPERIQDIMGGILLERYPHEKDQELEALVESMSL